MSVYILSATRLLSPIPAIGDGDEDVCTKSGRSTNIMVEVGEPQFTADKFYVYIPVTYEVREVTPDHTNLRLDTECKIAVPTTLRGKKLEIDNIKAVGYSYQATIKGKNHSFNRLPNQIGSCVRDGMFKFDDEGDDDQGNAALLLNFRIPINVK